MKKFILPLLVLLFVGSLFAVESAPSEVVGYVKYDMVIGNSLVAIPMESPWGWASELGSTFEGNVDQVSYFDPTSQSFMTTVDLGGFWMDDFEIGTNSVLMLNSYAETAFFSIGDLPETNATFSLIAGNNTMMVPLNMSYYTMASEVGTDMSAGMVDQVSYFDSSSQSFMTTVDLGGFWMDDFEVSIGMPLMANSYDAFTWPTRSAVTPLSTRK
jgi:formylglycine-generating enzyme required for sulfatase activity